MPEFVHTARRNAESSPRISSAEDHPVDLWMLLLQMKSPVIDVVFNKLDSIRFDSIRNLKNHVQLLSCGGFSGVDGAPQRRSPGPGYPAYGDEVS